MSTRDGNVPLETSPTEARRWLSEVRLEKFKAAFRPDPIPLDIFNIIIGRNGSGKSTLLEALQWVATTIRRDAREASERYFGIHDLINLRSQANVPEFRLTLTWSCEDSAQPRLRYRVAVQERDSLPFIAEEDLSVVSETGGLLRRYIRTLSPGERTIFPDVNSPATRLVVQDPDRLALALLSGTPLSGVPWIAFVSQFWTRAVFLRLSPNSLTYGSPATRKSFEPLLDEEGQTLPALLNELSPEQRIELVAWVQDILPGITNVEVSRADIGRDTRVNYSLLERMPYRGRAGRQQFPIPSWMLSEGTRRITAILALLVRRPAPALLCIEEIENGLDPWTIQRMLQYIQSAADERTQVLLSTHSPWLLDHVPLETIIQVRRIGGDTKYEKFSEREAVRNYQAGIPAGTRYVNEAE